LAVRRDRIRTAIIGTGGIARQHVRRLIDSGELGRPLVAVCNTLWYREVVDCLRAGRRPQASGAEARRSVEFLASLYKSAHTNQPVQRGSVQ
jgi:predicted dehydrogenase